MMMTRCQCGVAQASFDHPRWCRPHPVCLWVALALGYGCHFIKNSIFAIFSREFPFVSAGAEADPSVAGAVSTNAAFNPISAAAAPTGTNTAALAANAGPAASINNAAALSKSPSVGGYTTGTLEAMMHGFVTWVFIGQQALTHAQEWHTVLELAQPKRQDAHDAPACPLSKFITTEAIQGGVIALKTSKITRQHDKVSFCQETACRQILWSDGPWTGGEIEPALENYHESEGYKPTATCKECEFKKLCVLPSLMPTEVPHSPPSPQPLWCCLKCPLPEGCVGVQRRRPEPTMTNWGNASKICAKYPAGHSRAQ